MKKSMRVAVFAHEFPALSETFVLDQIESLIDRGHEVVVFARRPRPEARVHADVVRYDLGRVTRYRNTTDNKFVLAIRAGALFLRYLHRLGPALIRCLDIRRFGPGMSRIDLMLWAVRTAPEEPFDAIYCHFGPVGRIAATLRDIGVLSGPLTTVFHGVDISAYLRRKPDAYRFLFAEGQLFLPVSARWRRRLVDLGCPPDKVVIHHMGVPAAKIPFRPKNFEPNTPLRILSVGRMVEKKGLAFAIRAVARLIGSGIPIRYTIIGDGPLRQHLRQLAASLGIESEVDFRGWQDRTVVADAMATHHILLAPSVATADGDEEGIPVTIMEAMASGAIVVSTRHSGIPELVEDGKSGFLASEGSVDDLVAIVARLARNTEEWPSIRYNARARVAADFDAAIMNETLERRLRWVADAWYRHAPTALQYRQGGENPNARDAGAFGRADHDGRLVRHI